MASAMSIHTFGSIGAAVSNVGSFIYFHANPPALLRLPLQHFIMQLASISISFPAIVADSNSLMNSPFVEY